MRQRVERLLLKYEMELVSFGGYLRVHYTPFTEKGALDQLSASFVVGGDSTKPPAEEFKRLHRRARVVGRALSAFVNQGQLEIEVDGVLVAVPWTVTNYKVDVEHATIELLKYRLQGGLPIAEGLAISDLPSGVQRVIASLTTTADRLAWNHLRGMLGLPDPASDASGADKSLVAFISYRSPHGRFAEALARRLGEEGILPWFDKWEILAGDSVPGKIEQGLRESVAFVPIITADYQQGAWATEELRTAIVKRIETDFKIIPVLLEKCPVPELVRHLRYVDFTAQDPETFESRVGELVDAIFGLAVNPFRP